MVTIQIQIKDGKSRTKKIKYHNPLKQAVLTTISFFDIFSRPLRLQEIEEYLFRTAASEIDVAIMLKRLQNEGLIQEKNSFWFLRGREKTISIRKDRNRISKEKIKRAIYYARFIKLIPFVKSISIANSLSFHNAKKSSDIDLFIITSKNRLWITRTFTAFLLKSLGVKRRKDRNYDPDRFCMSFFATTKNLNFKQIYREPFDPYLSFWLAGLKPLYGLKIFNRFVAKNLWYKRELPNHHYKTYKNKIIIQNKSITGFLRFIVEKSINLLGGGSIDKWLYGWQSRMVIEGADWDEVGVGIIARRQMLKTHAHDKRQYFRDKLEERLKENLKTT